MAYVLIFIEYFKIKQFNLNFKESETCCNKLYSKVPSNVVVTDCPFTSAYNHLTLCNFDNWKHN